MLSPNMKLKRSSQNEKYFLMEFHSICFVFFGLSQFSLRPCALRDKLGRNGKAGGQRKLHKVNVSAEYMYGIFGYHFTLFMVWVSYYCC